MHEHFQAPKLRECGYKSHQYTQALGNLYVTYNPNIVLGEENCI